MYSLVNGDPFANGSAADAILVSKCSEATTFAEILLNDLIFDVHFWLICSQPISGRDTVHLAAVKVPPLTALNMH